MSKNKKLLIIILLIAIITVIGSYWLYKKSKVVSPATTSVPSQKTSAPTKVSSDTINLPFLPPSGKLFYYSPKERTLKKINLATGQPEFISSLPIPPNKYVSDIIWSPDEKSLFIKTTGSDTGTTFYLYNLAQKKLSPLNSHIISLVWLSKGDKIVYQYLDEENNINQLNLSAPDGSDQQLILSFPQLVEFFLLRGLSEQEILAAEEPSDISETKIYRINLLAKTQTLLSQLPTSSSGYIVRGNNLFYIFSSSPGQQFALVKYNLLSGQKSALEMDVPSISRVAINEEGTLVVVAKQEIAGKIKSFVFYKIDSKKNQKSRIEFTSQQPFTDVENLMLSPDEKTLYFISENILYKLNISS